MQNIKLKHTNPETEKYNLKPKKIYESVISNGEQRMQAQCL